MRYFTFAIITLVVGAGVLYGQVTDESVEDLMRIVAGEDPIAAAAAIRTIGELNTPPEGAIKRLVASLADDRVCEPPRPFAIPAPYETIGVVASSAIAKIGQPAVAEISQFLKDEQNEAAVRLAIQTLLRIEGDRSNSLPVLRKLLTANDNVVRLSALQAIIEIEQDADELSTAIGKALEDESPDVRVAAARGLYKLGEQGARHVPRLVELLEDQNSRWDHIAPDMVNSIPVRYDVAISIGDLGKGSRSALDKLSTMMASDEEPIVRVAAAYAISNIDDSETDAIDYLVGAINDEQYGYATQESAAEQAGKLGPRATVALPGLEKLLEHSDEFVQCTAARAIVQISPETAEAKLINMLSDDDAYVRSEVIKALGSRRSASPELLAHYIAALDCFDEEDYFSYAVRREAALALGKLGSDAAPALPKLHDMVQAEDLKEVKEAALEAIRQISHAKATNSQPNKNPN